MATRSVRVSLPLLVTVMLGVLVGASSVVLAKTSSPSIRDAASCPVTFQPGVLDAPLMGWGSAEAAYGTDELSVTLPHGGSLQSSNLDAEGRIWDKFLFWGSSGEGGIEISGRRLDAEAPPLISDGIQPGTGGGLATMITFPTTGCWEVTADRGDIALTFVLLVARAWEYPAGMATPLTNERRLNGCDVTRPNASTPPGQQPATTWYGNGILWTRLGADGVIVPSPEEWTLDRQIVIDGWPWVAVDPHSTFAIEGSVISSIDGTPTASDGRFLGVVMEPGGAEAQVRMHFSQPGCWEITGAAPGGSLTVTVLVLPPAEERLIAILAACPRVEAIALR